jgi:hypothetical protein
MLARFRFAVLISAVTLAGSTFLALAPPAHALSAADVITCGGDEGLAAASRSLETPSPSHYASVQLLFLAPDGQLTGEDNLELVGNGDAITTTVPHGTREAVIVNDPVPLSDDPIQIKIAPEKRAAVVGSSSLVGLTVTLRATVERISDDHALELCGEIRVRVTAT